MLLLENIFTLLLLVTLLNSLASFLSLTHSLVRFIQLPLLLFSFEHSNSESVETLNFIEHFYPQLQASISQSFKTTEKIEEHATDTVSQGPLSVDISSKKKIAEMTPKVKSTEVSSSVTVI